MASVHRIDCICERCERFRAKQDRVSDAELSAAIAATETAIRALANVPGGLVDCDKITVRALKELQERRTIERRS